jgi:hypothetical protein
VRLGVAQAEVLYTTAGYYGSPLAMPRLRRWTSSVWASRDRRVAGCVPGCARRPRRGQRFADQLLSAPPAIGGRPDTSLARTSGIEQSIGEHENGFQYLSEVRRKPIFKVLACAPGVPLRLR